MTTESGAEALLLGQHIPADREEPWRRSLQELSGSRLEEYAASRERRGIRAEHVWFLPDPSPTASGGGVAVVSFEAGDPEGALRELASSGEPFDVWYGREILNLGASRPMGPPRARVGEQLFSWKGTSEE